MIIDKRVMERVEREIRELSILEGMSLRFATTVYIAAITESLVVRLTETISENRSEIPAGTLHQILNEDDALARFEYARELRHQYGQHES